MEGGPLELPVMTSELESETVDQMDQDKELCTHWSVKPEPEDVGSFSVLAGPGKDSLASPMESMLEFHANKNEENPLHTIQLPPTTGEGNPQTKAHKMNEECPEKDLVHIVDLPEPVQTSTPNDSKSLVDVSIPTDFIEVKLEDEPPTQSACEVVGAAASLQVVPSSPIQKPLDSVSSIPIPPVASRGQDSVWSQGPPTSPSKNVAGQGATPSPVVERRPATKMPCKPKVKRKLDDMAKAKLELVELQIKIAKNKLKRLKGCSTIEEAEASLRRTEYQMKLEKIKRQYERELEKEKLRAEISRIDMEIKKYILLKKRAKCNKTK